MVTETYKKSDGTTITVTDEDYSAALEMSEEERHRAALDDPDAQPITEENLKNLKRVNPQDRNHE